MLTSEELPALEGSGPERICCFAPGQKLIARRVSPIISLAGFCPKALSYS